MVTSPPRAVVTAATAFVLTLVASTGVLWEVKRRNDASLEAFRQMQGQQRSALEFALSAIDQMTRSVMDNRGNVPGARADDEARRVFPYAIAFSEHVRKSVGDTPSTREIVAKAFRQSGRARLMLGDPRGREDYRHAIQVYEDLATRSPERIWLRTGLIETLREYASLLAEPIDAAEAHGSARRAIEIAETLIGDRSVAAPRFRKELIGPFGGQAWNLVSHVPVRPGDVTQAVRIAWQAVDWDADQPDSWRSLGIACYRSRDWQSAAASFRRAMDLDGDGTAADWFFLAAINHQLGNDHEARRWYDRAISWLKQAPDRAGSAGAELRRSRDEALRALGPATPKAGAANGGS